MSERIHKPEKEALLAAEGTFVVQLRSDSNLQQRSMRGRVEHVMSGQSEPFTSLAALLAFMARYTPNPPPA